MNYISKINEIEKRTSGYWAERIITQLKYAVKISKVNKCAFDNIIEKAVNVLEKQTKSTEAITKDIVSMVEKELAELSTHAKKYTLLNVAHAHIDMNWMWDYAETVAITLETFRTMLDLMNEYPEFVFSQSQASVYRIVEKHDPEMLKEIKARVKEGRWEVTASTWVEADKNMPNGESHARHILYTKRYLSELLDLSPDMLLLDYEPDTFGHNRNVPEILSKGGVKYYYHCRAVDDKSIYRWQSPSGKSILVFRDPMWYNLNVQADGVLYVPEFCEKHGVDSAMRVYGVGDHGGGPTRKDIESLMDMDTWPIYPNIKFSTYAEYFKKIEEIKDTLPVVEGELNFVFSGCYTTQARIKTANRVGEVKLDEAETLSAVSSIFCEGDYPSEDYKKSWLKVLFNQFHDILPGSGTVDTREYAMGEFQKVLAYTNTGMVKAMKNIASKINTDSLDLPVESSKTSRSEGGGVGFEMGNFNIPHPERGTGLNRIFTVFNPTQFDRREVTEIIIWDWEGDKKRLSVKNSKGIPIQSQVLEFNKSDYWGHTFTRFLIMAEVPAYGYSTYVVSEHDAVDVDVTWPTWPRLETPDVLVLENDLVRAEFEEVSMRLKSLINKSDGTESIDCKKGAGFRYIEEDTSKGMTAWCIGRYMKQAEVSGNLQVVETSVMKDDLKQWISYEQEFKSSRLKVKISLDRDAAEIKYEVECDWQERAVRGKYIPQLNFQVPLSYDINEYKYDIPFGTISRGSFNQDVPANSWMAASNKSGLATMLVTKNKYGFRGYDDSLAVTLLRSSYDPDPYPDNGIQKFDFAVSLIDMQSEKQFIESSCKYNHSLLYVSNKKHAGELALDKGFIKIESSNAVVSAIKTAEDFKSGLVFRLYETEGVSNKVRISFDKTPAKACLVDLNEKPLQGDIVLDGKSIQFTIDAYSVETLLVEFEG